MGSAVGWIKGALFWQLAEALLGPPRLPGCLLIANTWAYSRAWDRLRVLPTESCVCVSPRHPVSPQGNGAIPSQGRRTAASSQLGLPNAPAIGILGQVGELGPLVAFWPPSAVLVNDCKSFSLSFLFL